jgi:hypothetical protein
MAIPKDSHVLRYKVATIPVSPKVRIALRAVTPKMVTDCRTLLPYRRPINFGRILFKHKYMKLPLKEHKFMQIFFLPSLFYYLPTSAYAVIRNTIFFFSESSATLLRLSV